jgi:hypothetical protein
MVSSILGGATVPRGALEFELVCLLNKSGFAWILSSTKGPSPLKVLTNCETRVGIKVSPSFLNASFLKKKKVAASFFFGGISLQESVLAQTFLLRHHHTTRKGLLAPVFDPSSLIHCSIR